ncbi:hypothetical protein ACIQVU_00870 [Lysinibacillus sp. NPDC098008]|uniref:hypothetical protein n=1 Tax=Lysinibacillus sp. NPDC098008 TaxID=3364146 RepID=UPI003827EB50
MKKTLIVFASMLMLLVVLAACSNNGDDKEKETAEKNDTGSLVISGDIVSEQGGCVLASRFSPGDKIIFRNNVVDGITNEQVKDAKVQVHLSTGETLDMTYGEHGDDNFWVVAYPVTADTPTGTINYTVTAEYKDQKGEFKPFNVAPSLLTIVSEDVSAAPQEEPTTEEEEVDLATVETNQNVEIIGKNFEFHGPNGEQTFYVKAGEEVTLSLKSEEGVHGVSVDGLDVKLDKDGSTKFTPEKAGEYNMSCSVFCGTGHGDMTAKLVVVE